MTDATLSYFRGRWQMTRIVEQMATGVIGEVWGDAEFTDADQGLRCEEVGVLRFQGADFHTARTSLWQVTDGRVHVAYADGRPFHDFLMRAPIALAVDEGADYEITYAFEPDYWVSLWRMTTDDCRYEMSTRYRR